MRLLAALMLLAALLPAGTAQAYVAPGATIVSASLQRLEQGDDSSSQVAISADGRYVVFQTRARNLYPEDAVDPPGAFAVGGVFRRDLVTGSLEQVAAGDLRPEADPGRLLVRGAQNPSVSADGRFVSFSTGHGLVPADANGHVDVYVRDMTRPLADPGAYDLVSARSGGDAPPAYEAPAPDADRPGLNPGAEATARVAMSADGRRVVFRTLVASDLPAEGGASTPARQLWVRDRETRETRLVTRTVADGAPAGGAIGAGTISGDGTSVLWVGREAPSQTPFLDGEGANAALEYYLWQRIADGPSAPTRRISGIVDLDDPLCPPGSAIVDSPGTLGPCYGPLGQVEGFVGGIVGQVPAMSADGRRIAYVTTASKRAEQSAGISGDLFVTEIGGSRKAATVELTRDGAGDATINSPLETVSMSADGRWIAVTTFRTTFTLPALRLVSPVRPVAAVREIYLVDLQERSIERVLRGYAGDDVNGSVVGATALAADGSRLAFVSDASNLFFGDANDRSDAFVVDRRDGAPPDPPDPEPVVEEPPPVAEPSSDPAPERLTVAVRRGSRGSVILRVRAPRAGRIAAVARGRLPDAAGRPSGPVRTLASAAQQARRAGTVAVRLTLRSSLRGRARQAGRLVGQAEVQLTASGGRRYLRRVTVSFIPDTAKSVKKR